MLWRCDFASGFCGGCNGVVWMGWSWIIGLGFGVGTLCGREPLRRGGRCCLGKEVSVFVVFVVGVFFCGPPLLFGSISAVASSCSFWVVFVFQVL